MGKLSKVKEAIEATKRQLTEYEKAHKIAQENAALPVEKGGLGLPPDNTAMDRARAMGFDVSGVRFHETGSDAISGIGERGFSVKTPKAAKSDELTPYSVFTKDAGNSIGLAKGNEVQMPLLSRSNRELSFNNRHEMESYLSNDKDIKNALYDAEEYDKKMAIEFDRLFGKGKRNNPEYDDKKINSLLDEWANGKAQKSEFAKNLITNKLKLEGYDAINLINDEGSLGRSVNTRMDLFPENIRSRFAAFDPFNKDSSNILASLGAGTTVGAGLMAAPDEAEAGIVSRNIPRASGIAAGSLAADAVFSESPAYQERYDNRKSLGLENIDARYGELGKIKNPDGSHSTEYSITEFIPELGGWVNIPTLVKGQVGVESLLSGEKITPEQFKISVRRAIERKRLGQELPSYGSLQEALMMAEARTNFEKELNYINMGQETVNYNKPYSKPSTSIDAYIRKRNERRAGHRQLKYERMAGNPVQTIEAPQGAIRQAAGIAGEKLGNLNRRLEGGITELVAPTGLEDFLKAYAYKEATPLDAVFGALDLGMLATPFSGIKSISKPLK